MTLKVAPPIKNQGINTYKQPPIDAKQQCHLLKMATKNE